VDLKKKRDKVKVEIFFKIHLDLGLLASTTNQKKSLQLSDKDNPQLGVFIFVLK
jgi:hypothetical protein